MRESLKIVVLASVLLERTNLMAKNQVSPCAVILTALPVEFQAVHAHLFKVQEKTVDVGTLYWLGTFPCQGCNWKVSVAEIGTNNSVAALETERAISAFDPDVILFVGVAGGLKNVEKGDVVAADEIYNYESGKDGVEFLPRTKAAHATNRMVYRAKAVSNTESWIKRIKGTTSPKQPNAFVKAIAAGEKVVNSFSSPTYKRLESLYSGVLALEMEGYGFLRAVYGHSQVDALVIRGISDLIEDKTNTNDNSFQDIASRHASAFAFEVLAQLGSDEVFLSQVREKSVKHDVKATQRPASKYSINKNSGQMVVGDKARMINH